MKLIARIIIILVIFGVGFYLGYGYIKIPSSEKNQIESNRNYEKTASLMLDFGNGDIKIFKKVLSQENSTVFNFLNSITKENNIHLEYKDYGGETGVFIEAVGGSVSDFKTDKFWQFWVNNEYAQISSSKFKLNDGDVILWKYTSSQLSITN